MNTRRGAAVLPKSRNVGTLTQNSLIKSEAKFIAGHRPSGIQYLSPVSEHSGTEIGPRILVPDWFWHRHFCSFRYWTDQIPHYPAFQHLKKGYIHPACPYCSDGLGYTLHVNKVHPSRPYCWWWKGLYHARAYCWQWSGIHPARPFCWRLKGIHIAHPYCWRWKGIPPTRPKTAADGVTVAIRC